MTITSMIEAESIISIKDYFHELNINAGTL